MNRIDTQLATVAKMLYIAMGYESREKRIKMLLDSPNLNISMMARILKANGLLDEKSVLVRESDVK